MGEIRPPAVLWFKSTYSTGGGECVEVADLAEGVRGVRDSKLGEGSPVLRLPAGQFAAFTDEIKTGRFG
jgi:Domain of unknown function (DUF397)